MLLPIVNVRSSAVTEKLHNARYYLGTFSG